MIHKGTVEITTERLLLRKIVLEDAKTLFKYGGWGVTLQEANGYIEKLINPYQYKNYYHWGIEFENRIVGRIKVSDFSDRDNYAELSYDIVPEFQCKGLMTEAIKAVINFLFKQVNCNRIFVHIRANNTASNRVAQKAGMKLEGVLRNHYSENNGTYVDVKIYGLLRDEYLAI